jgi:hypothetical protein
MGRGAGGRRAEVAHVSEEPEDVSEEPERTLAAPELRELRAALALTRGRRRLDVILDSPDPRALVRALPADELYLTVREIGLADAVPLVQLASPEQFKTFLDLDAWGSGVFDVARSLPWFRAARAGAHLEDELAQQWADKLAALDAEVLFLVLGTTLRLHDLEQDPDPEIAGDRYMRTPEGKYVIEFLVDGVEYAAVRGLLDDLYAEDPFKATRLLASLPWEMRSELEESALRWRTGRLADLGHPSLEEALSWFARPSHAPARAAAPPVRPPGFLLATLARGSLLDRAAARLEPEARESLEAQIVTAANAVVVASSVDPADVDAVRDAFEAARGMLELGLERLGGADDERAAEVLAREPVKRIFQQGFGRVLELAWRARDLRRRAGDARLGSPVDEALAALVARRPRYFPGVEVSEDEWGTAAAAAHDTRHFRSADDLARTARALDRADAILTARGA